MTMKRNALGKVFTNLLKNYLQIPQRSHNDLLLSVKLLTN